jgi:hypothetical protein
VNKLPCVQQPMRAMFLIYVVVITAGITYFTIIGLTHH